MIHIASMGGRPSRVKTMLRKDRAKELPNHEFAVTQTFSVTRMASLQPSLMAPESSR